MFRKAGSFEVGSQTGTAGVIGAVYAGLRDRAIHAQSCGWVDAPSFHGRSAGGPGTLNFDS